MSGTFSCKKDVRFGSTPNYMVGASFCYLFYWWCVTYTGVEDHLMLSKFLFLHLHVCTDVGLCHFRLGIRVFSVVYYGGVIVIRYPIKIPPWLWIAVSNSYNTFETKEVARIGHSGVPFQPEYSGEGRDAQNEMRYVYWWCVTYTGVEDHLMLSKFLFLHLHVCTDVGLCHFRLGIRVFSVV
jgi:hypothetical protein